MPQNDGQGETHQLYAWIAADPNGIEGIITAPIPGLGIVPLVCTGTSTAELMRNDATIAAALRGSTARLIRFDRAEVLDQIEPR